MMIMFNGFSFSLFVQPLPGSFLPGPVPGAQQQFNRYLLNEEMNAHCVDLDSVQECGLKAPMKPELPPNNSYCLQLYLRK